MKKEVKIILFGILSWLIPFIISFFFYSKDGQPKIDVFLFKSIMIVVGAITGATLLVLYFKKIKKDYLKEGIIIGIDWLIINIVLDLIILIPMSGMTTGTYFAQIGLRYLIIPIMSISMGYIADTPSSRNTAGLWRARRSDMESKISKQASMLGKGVYLILDRK